MSANNREQSTAPPLVSFDPSGAAPLLGYNVPEPTAYAGRSYIELDLDTDLFRPEAKRGTSYREWISDRILRPAEEQLQESAAVEEAEAAAEAEAVEEVTQEMQAEAAAVAEESDNAEAAVVHVQALGGESTDRQTDLETLTGTVETMFRRGDSGPVVGATDERLTESVAAVGNASTLLNDSDDEVVDSTIRTTLEPTLFAAESLAEAGSDADATEVANATLTQSAVENDIDVQALRSIQPSRVAREMLDGRVPVARYTMGGRPTISYMVAPPIIEPKLVLVERYRLSTFLGNYGAGRTVKTFSLLPGEQTTISVKTFRKTAEERQEASSILDSYTTETAEEFEESVTAEQSHKEEHKQSFAYHAEAKAEAGWGWGKATVSGGVEGSSNATRQESAKNVATATSKHAAEASAKREVEIDTNYEVKAETGEETSIERRLENINLSRTLNFVFRQMNQEFVTLYHLVDVRVGFTNGGFAVRSGTGTLGGIEYREVSLPDLDELLEDVIVEDQREHVKQLIEGELSNIFNYRGERRSMVEDVEFSQSDAGPTYLRVNPDLRATYRDETGNEFTVPGIILSAEKNVMRTEGVIVEALLGGGEALDDYARDLQSAEAQGRLLENDQRRANIDREQLAQSLVSDGDGSSIDRFNRLFVRERNDEKADEAVDEPAPEPRPESDQGSS